jgi:hypothetical protein
VIYFNPLDWQFLFVIGIWRGMTPAKEQPVVLKSRLLLGAAVTYLLFALFITLGWQFHSLEAYVPTVVVRLIYPIDKGDLDILRLLHFLASALLFWRLLPCSLPTLRTRFMRPLVRCGEYSLPVYCVSVLLSFAAHAALNLGWNNLASQTLVSLAGIAVMVAALFGVRAGLRDGGHRDEREGGDGREDCASCHFCFSIVTSDKRDQTLASI